MTDTLTVLLGSQVAGTLTRAKGGKLTFVYDDAYRSAEAPTPVSVSMPPQIRSHPDRVVDPWLWGLLPDNDAVLARWARRFSVSATTPFGLLASPVGQDCAGAVRFVAPDSLDAALGRPGRVRWLTDDEVAARLARAPPGPHRLAGRRLHRPVQPGWRPGEDGPVPPQRRPVGPAGGGGGHQPHSQAGHRRLRRS